MPHKSPASPLLAPELSQLLVIAGPTASGKTALALALAQSLQAEGIATEIISVDSALVYRGMDIGTAKPSALEQAQLPHHLIDIRTPQQSYSAAEFRQDALELVRQIRARGALPLLVGGTMLYIHALLHGLDALPQADAAIRARLQQQAAEQGWPALHAWLAQVDAATAARLAPNDSQRVGRALEVWLATGTPLSVLHTRQQDDAQHAARQAWMASHLIALEPHSRTWLHERIARRFDLMLQAGFLEEVQHLRQMPGMNADLPAMRSVGYRQAWQMLDGEFPVQELPERAIAATRQLAKRQITWLRSMSSRCIVPCDEADMETRAIGILRDKVLRTMQHPATPTALDTPTAVIPAQAGMTQRG